MGTLYKPIFFLLFCGGISGAIGFNNMDRMAKLVQPSKETSANRDPEHLEPAMENHRKGYNRAGEAAPTFTSATYGKEIIGKNMKTINDRSIYAWQGIQYGKAPSPQNNLRFKPTVPTDMYDTMASPLIFNHLGFKCPQGNIIGRDPAGDEDCLYLNVYTPYLPGTPEGKNLPVMLFIHGGGFIGGDASVYMPTKLLEHDVILVTIHYRLGAFGFFSLNNEDAPGNPALYDMVESIRWTNKYIGDFGGDNGKVTVFGESAGSVSASYMLILPQVKDLVHGIISESGSVLEVWALDENPSEAAEYIGNYLGCTWANDSELFDCVNAAPQADIVNAENSFVHTDRSNGLMGFRGAAPTIQTYTGATYELLVTKHPRQYFYDREVNDVPLMMGTNKQEGSYVLGVMYWEYFVANNFLDNSTWMNNTMVYTILGGFGIDDNTHAMSTSLTNQYCSGVDMSIFDDVAPCLIDMVGVMFLKSGGWETSNLHSYFTNQKTFYYSFDFTSDDSLYVWLLGAPPFDPGVTHSDEMMYLFSMPAVMEDQQIVTMDRMTLMWTNFAKYGNPTPDEDTSWQNLGLPDWPEFHTDDHHFMLMRDEFTTDMAEFPDRWTVTLNELRGHETSTPTWPEYDEVMEENDALQDENQKLTDDKDDIENKSDTYLITMIVFVVAFILADFVIAYLVFKK